MLSFLIPIVVFAGFLIGALLAYISPEEMKPGREYFFWLFCALSVAILSVIFYYGGFSVFGLLLGIVFGFFVREYYFALGLAIAMSFLVSDSALLLLGTLSFAFGLVYGTITVASGKFTFTNVFAKLSFFFIPFIILFAGVPPKHFLSFSGVAFATILVVKAWQKFYKD